MVNYNNSEINNYLGQYKMLESSLSLIFDERNRERIINELTSIMKKIIMLTNVLYEEEYTLLLGASSYFIGEEKNRLESLVNLIEQRKLYLGSLNEKHRFITGVILENNKVMGIERLEEFKERLNIINKYNENIEEKEKLLTEIASLDNKISLANEKISINNNLNKELEKKLITLIKDTLNKYELFSLLSDEEEITETFEQLLYSLDLASRNVELAKNKSTSLLIECQNVLISTTKDYKEYEEKKYILELIKLYEKETTDYQDLVNKREKINDIMSKLTDCEFYPEIIFEINKQYNTIKIEIQDIKNYNNLKEEKAKLVEKIELIEKENNSDKFKSILNEMLENEQKQKEERDRLKRQKEHEEKQRKLLLEQEQRIEQMKKQKVIEDKRKKEQEERAKQLLRDQERSIFAGKSFNSIRDEKQQKVERSNDNMPSLEQIKNNIESSMLNKREIPIIKNDEMFPDL